MKKPSHPAYPEIDSLIIDVRGQKIILDSALARIYGVQTKALNQAVKRNMARFPEDFLFRLTLIETAELNRSQIVTGSQRHRDPRFRPYAFTEHGAIMAANVLNSASAVDMSVFVVRAFVKIRSALTDTRELARKLAVLETELTSRMDVHEAAIVEVLQRVMTILDPPPPPPSPPPPEIGFHVKEDAFPYKIGLPAIGWGCPKRQGSPLTLGPALIGSDMLAALRQFARTRLALKMGSNHAKEVLTNLESAIKSELADNLNSL